MKLTILSLIVFIFVVMPLYVLNTMIMPELMQLKQTYEHADSIATQLTQAQ